ncbi:MAG: single-stranded-DNA-specific exonuclease RecJ [Deltaproteobacteria bacterium]|nr:single-stranded-DNA-specific exonuclease RecJ [Deltaproteobacteria bacterium]
MKKKWVVRQADESEICGICQKTGFHPAVAGVMANRGIVSGSDIDAFLSPSMSQLHSFFSLKDMDKAVERIARALTENENILVFGDYDADGITSAAIVYEFLRMAGARVSRHLPHRIKEGYGITASHVQDIAVPGEIGLIITTDCGIGSHEAVKEAGLCGIDVIITDHHTADAIVPNAFAVINPKQPGCGSGFNYLAGVGVAFYLLICLRKHLRDTGYWNKYPEPNLKAFSDLAAIGTIADIVPLVRENRIIARMGLSVINTSPRPGIRALIESSGIDKQVIDAGDIAFRLAPRLNAAGRMDHAKIGFDLLTCDDIEHARKLSALLNNLNSKRQSVERQIFDHAVSFLDQESYLLENKSIVLGDPSWHQGVLGIVASRLVEKHYRPVVLFSISSGIAKGSARSIPGINIYDLLAECSDYLIAFGGHAMAAGLSLDADKVSEFARKFETVLMDRADDFQPDLFYPKIYIDGHLDLDILSDSIADEIELLSPFGQGNPEPLFVAGKVSVLHSKRLKQKHRRMVLARAGSKSDKKITAIWFNCDPVEDNYTYYEKIAFRLRKNYYNGRKSLQIMVEAAEHKAEGM